MRGKPEKGARLTKKAKLLQELKDKGILIDPTTPGVYVSAEAMKHILTQKPGAKPKKVKEETDAEIDKRIAERFDVLKTMVHSCINTDSRATIISGPPGLGKSFEPEKILKEWDPTGAKYTIVKGFVRATGLFKMLYKHRLPGQVLVFDDADSVFFDDTSLNLLKAALDTTEKRVVSYLSETIFVDEDTGEPLPKRFEFEGTVIFITNYDFDEMIATGHRFAKHMEAMRDRAHYIDMQMKTRRDYIVRIGQVFKEGLLDNLGDKAKKEIMEFMKKNIDNLKQVSIRTAIKIGQHYKVHPTKWQAMAKVTEFYND